MVKQLNISMSKHYCPIPFHHIAIRPNGTVQPCCAFRWNEIPEDFTLDYKNLFYEHPFMKKIRDDLRKDLPVAGCSECYKAEELTGKSMRTEYIQEHRLGFSDTPPEQEELTYIDLALSNVCNNRCRMCSYELSTNWYQDAKSLGVQIPRGLIEHKNNLDDIDFSRLTYIKMIGGEPLMEQDKFIEVLKKCQLENMNILITTNATVRPNDELLGLLNQCKKVRWNLSIDTFGPLNDFLRKGSKWDNVLSNLHWFVERFPKNVNVNGVVSLYNANVFYQLADYVNKNFKDCRVAFNIVDGPDWMMLKHLPDAAKQYVKQTLESNTSHVIVPRVIEAMEQAGSVETFVKFDSQLNSLRKEHWQLHNPELFEFLKDFY